MEEDEHFVRLKGSDMVAIKIALQLYAKHIQEHFDDGDPEGEVADLEHVTALIEKFNY